MSFVRLKSNEFRFTLLVVTIGTIATAVVATQVSRIAQVKDKERFDRIVSEAQLSILERLNSYITMLRAGAGFVSANDGVVTRKEFRRFVDELHLPTRYRGVQGIGFTAILADRTSVRAANALAAYGVPDLALYPPGARDQVHAIVHLEPLDRRNIAALGYDMYSEPVRRAAMSRARDTGEPAASGRVQLVQEIDEAKQAGFLIYVPVYSGMPPQSLEQRRERLTGFVYSPFRADDLMQGIFGTARPRLKIEIFDGAVDATNLLHRSADDEMSTASYQTERSMDVAGRLWTVRYTTREEFDRSSGRDLVPYVSLGGALTTLLLASLTFAQARAKRNADQVATMMQANAHELKVLHATATRLSAELDPDRLVQEVTDAGRALSGAEIGAFFYNVKDEKGGSYYLFTLSGAPVEAFARLGKPRNTAVFGPTFRGEGVVRADDITADPRFGKNEPFKGFPAGHWPVRSYLAVPVISSSGEVIGGLFFGHSKIGVFTEQSESSVLALASHAAIALDNAKLLKASKDELAARKKIEAHQKLLLDELNHRVKNTLAIVQSIAAHTLRSSSDPESVKRSFEARLVALSEAHNLLSQQNWRGAELRDLVERELAPYRSEWDGRIEISGEAVWLTPKAAVALGMALHELSSNAARHGSLSSPEGRVKVSWNTSATRSGRHLQLLWQESDGPMVVEPTQRGFGSTLIERGLKYDLHGNAKMHFESTGLRCVIEADISTELQVA